MTREETETAKRDFLAGRLKSLQLGGYGGTVRLLIQPQGVLIRTTKPKRRQTVLSPNTEAVRRTALDAAEQVLARIRKMPAKRVPSLPAKKDRSAGVLTPRDVWLAYLRGRLGSIPEDEVLRWGKKAIAKYVRGLPEGARELAGSVDYLSSVVLAARRLHQGGVVPLDGHIELIQPGHLQDWAVRELHAGKSSRTVNTYLDRFQTAVREYRRKWPRVWDNRDDPTKGRIKVPTQEGRGPGIAEERVEPLLEAMKGLGLWRARATAMVAEATARRVGSISGERVGLHMDASPLTENDFARKGGRWMVTWRADAQKGGAYGRGDVELPATRQLVLVYRWLRRFHPNPVGPSHPLIWSERDPAKAASYNRLRLDLGRAWEEAFGEKKPRGLAWHAFCRMAISIMVDEVGLTASADYSGRSVGIIARVYRRPRATTLQATAERLDRFHLERRAGATGGRRK